MSTNEKGVDGLVLASLFLLLGGAEAIALLVNGHGTGKGSRRWREMRVRQAGF